MSRTIFKQFKIFRAVVISNPIDMVDFFRWFKIASLLGIFFSFITIHKKLSFANKTNFLHWATFPIRHNVLQKIKAAFSPLKRIQLNSQDLLTARFRHKKSVISLAVIIIAFFSILSTNAYAIEDPLVEYEDRTLPELSEKLRALDIDQQIRSDEKLDMHSHPIDNVEDPTDAQDAATKNYIDTFVGSSNIVTLGTITTGVWNATIITMAKGGTGANLTNDPGGILYCAASVLAILADSTDGLALTSGGTGAPVWEILTMGAGGTGANLTNDPGGLLYCAASTLAVLADGTTGQGLTSGGTGAPSWTDKVQMKTGTFTGDGDPTQGITGVGFQPKVVIVWDIVSGQDAHIKTDQDAGTKDKDLGATAYTASGFIESLDADGFTVGSNFNTSSRGHVYVALTY